MTDDLFPFYPVSCNKGRKWKGSLAYVIGFTTDNWGTSILRLWDPTAKCINYASEKFCIKLNLDDAVLEAAKKQYVDDIITSTINWCRFAKPNSSEDEITQFARNVLKKNHPEMSAEIDAVCPDKRDVVGIVEKTLQWAMTLKTRPCYIYGRHCPGGKPLADEKKVAIAYKALQKKGITSRAEFKDVWEFMLEQMNLPMNLKS